MSKITTQQWIQLFIIVVVIDLFVFLGILYYFAISSTTQIVYAATPAFTPVPTMTPTLWAGPPPTVTPTPTLPPTPISTATFNDGQYVSEYVPTPRAPYYQDLTVNFDITSDLFFYTGKRLGRIPIINQLQYPEPFFPAGYNNACGPVALYASFLGMGAKMPYRQLRDIAVRNQFGAEGITVSGLVNTARILNSQLGNPFVVENSRQYTLSDLRKHIQQGGAVIVLLRLRKVNGEYQVTADKHNSFGHFLVVEKVNMLTRRVSFAGSTLGMNSVPLDDFISSWTSRPPETRPKRPVLTLNWLSITEIKPEVIKKDKSTTPTGWAMALKQK